MRTIAIAVAVLALAGCAEDPDRGARVRAADTPPWTGAQDPYMASGWKTGDRASWESQLRNRTAGQNEYVRIGGRR